MSIQIDTNPTLKLTLQKNENKNFIVSILELKLNFYLVCEGLNDTVITYKFVYVVLFVIMAVEAFQMYKIHGQKYIYLSTII